MQFRKVKSVRYNTKSVSCLAPKYWTFYQRKEKILKRLIGWKQKSKKKVFMGMPLQALKTYVPQEGFILIVKICKHACHWVSWHPLASHYTLGINPIIRS